MKRKPFLLSVVFTAALLSATLGESTLPAAANPPQENWDLHLKRGDEQYAAERYTEALEAYREAVRLKPDYAKAHFGLINTYSKLNRSEEGWRYTSKRSAADRTMQWRTMVWVCRMVCLTCIRSPGGGCGSL